MSHWVNDNIIDGIIMDVSDMSDIDVINSLNGSNITKVAKFDGSTHDCNIIDFARDVLIDQMWDDVIDAGTPHG